MAGGAHDPHYLGYFECFNREQFYEAHDVLEELWLECRKQPDDLFFKGLIQLAGAFVHLQKSRLKPANVLFGLAEANLKPYAPLHRDLSVTEILALITDWRNRLVSNRFASNPLSYSPPPRLHLVN